MELDVESLYTIWQAAAGAEVRAELRTLGYFKPQPQACIFLVLPGSSGAPTPLPIKIRSRNLAVSFCMGRDGVQNHQPNSLLAAPLRSLDSVVFPPRKDGLGLSCCLKNKASPLQQECGPGREAVSKIMENTGYTYSISLYK